MEDCSYKSTQLLFQCVPGADGTGCKADLLHQSSAQVRNAWSCISATLYVFMAWRFITLRETLPLPLMRFITLRETLPLPLMRSLVDGKCVI